MIFPSQLSKQSDPAELVREPGKVLLADLSSEKATVATGGRGKGVLSVSLLPSPPVERSRTIKMPSITIRKRRKGQETSGRQWGGL